MRNFWIVIVLILILFGLGLYFSSHSERPSSDLMATSTVVITDKEKVIQDNKIRYEIIIFEPVLSGHANSTSFNDLVGRLFSHEVDEFVAQSTSDYNQNTVEIDKLKDSAFILELIGNASIINDRYVSLVVSKNFYVFNTAHPAHIIDTYVYDLDNKKTIEFSDIFSDTETALAYISTNSKEQIINDLKENNDEDFFYENGIDQVEANFDAYIISDNGVRFIFGEYQVVPYALGIQESIFTWEELKPLLTPEFKSLFQ